MIHATFTPPGSAPLTLQQTRSDLITIAVGATHTDLDADEARALAAAITAAANAIDRPSPHAPHRVRTPAEQGAPTSSRREHS